VRWSRPATMDLQQIHDYVAKDSKYYARKVVGTIVEKSEELGDFPEIGRIVPEINDPNIRELFAYSYRLIYEITPDGIEILTVIHGKRDFFERTTET
jgi:toxin ParE1/3/4